MNQADLDRFTALMFTVYEFYGRECSDTTLSVWWNALKPFDFETVKDALNRHVVDTDSGQYLPKPAHIVRLIKGDTKDAALVAWSKVDRAVREIGPYTSVEFDDPIIPAVIRDMGGWIALGNKTEEDWPFVRNEFVTRYRGYVIRAEKPAPSTLKGICEATNSALGYDHQEPVRMIHGPAYHEIPRQIASERLLGDGQ